MSASLRFTAPCLPNSTRTSTFAPPSYGPMFLISWRFRMRAWTRRSPPSPPCEAALTLDGRVHRFGLPHAALSPSNEESPHGRRQGFGHHFRIRGYEGVRTVPGGLLSTMVPPLPA